MLSEVKEFFRKRNARAQLREELSRLDDRELADIGITRSDLPFIIKDAS